MLDNIVYFLNIIWTYCTCMYYVSEINEYYYYYYYNILVGRMDMKLHVLKTYKKFAPKLYF